MTTKVREYLEEEIVWEENADAEYPYTADFNGERGVIRLNDFPDENLYTLIIDDAEIADFDDWPESWHR